MGADFGHLGNNALYRISDRVVEHRDEIERRLVKGSGSAKRRASLIAGVPCWCTVRMLLSTQTRCTASLTNDEGERIQIRQTADPESFHLEVYRALGLPPKPLRAKRLTV
ncbi:MAG: hypothetical protein Q7R39_02300 [Dehalococcoidia bacterium]|nr:hypothetical protein [Dehalococcoidia bacterium]